MRNHAAALAMLCVMVVNPGLAATAPADRPAAATAAPKAAFHDAPVAWRAYFDAAQAARKLTDPLQRCLVHPDLPGNQWPARHAEVHCRNHFDRLLVTADDIQAALAKGEVASLEARLDTLLARHFDPKDPREDIHYVFDALREATPAHDELTKQWLRRAPDSAYAHLARGAYLDGAAWDARGAKYAAETPRENMQRMSRIASQAVLMFEQAVALEPRLLPAYEGLLRMSVVDSLDDVGERAITQAERVDPGCVSMASERMRALQPRWGGSYPAMFQYAESLRLLQASRPHLAMYVGAPLADQGDRLVADDQYVRATLEVLDHAVSLGSNEEYLKDAANVALNATDGARDNWKGFAYLIQAERFSPQNAWAQRALARFLVRRDPDWALHHVKRALELEPADAAGHYLAGAAYYNKREFEAAQAAYLIAIEDAGQRQASLRELSSMWLYASGLPSRQRATRASPYIARLMREYPDDGQGWIMHLHERTMLDNHVDAALLKTVLQKADRNDPWQARAIQPFEELRAGPPAARPTQE
jgi:tetratricopeptide (TPR) repeat protein